MPRPRPEAGACGGLDLAEPNGVKDLGDHHPRGKQAVEGFIQLGGPVAASPAGKARGSAAASRAQGELVRDMLDWFAADCGAILDESTVHRRVQSVWRQLTKTAP
jgi:hypothetical protein